MRRFTQPAGLAPAVTMTSRAVFALTPTAVALTACGSNSGSPSASGGGSAGPVANASAVATAAATSVIPSTPAASVPPAASQAAASATPAAAAATPATSNAPATAKPAATAKPTAKPPATPKPKPPATPKPTTAPLEACALFSGTELSTLLGITGVQPRPMPSGGWVASQCAWNGPSSGFFLSVGTAASLKAAGDPAAPTAKAKLTQFKEQGGATAKDVPGIGDGAVLTTAGLAAYKGGTYLQLTNLGLTEDQLIKIAKLAIARL
jgi:hypothetical protein